MMAAAVLLAILAAPAGVYAAVSGGISRGDPTSSSSRVIALQAIALLNNSTYQSQLGPAPYTLVKLEKIASQVVSGYNYYLTMIIDPANANSAQGQVEVEVVMYSTPTNPPINSLVSVHVVSPRAYNP